MSSPRLTISTRSGLGLAIARELVRAGTGAGPWRGARPRLEHRGRHLSPDPPRPRSARDQSSASVIVLRQALRQFPFFPAEPRISPIYPMEPPSERENAAANRDFPSKFPQPYEPGFTSA
jgi:hypothetical protein